MYTGPKKRRKKPKRRKNSRKERKQASSGKLPATNTHNGKSPPLTERTDTKGLVELEVPWVGGKIITTWPATNRSVMVVICGLLAMLTIVVPCCCYIIFMGANPENLSSFGELFGSSEVRKPSKMPVKTGNGIEMIEVCPPCAICEEFDCADCMGECPTCPACPSPRCVTVVPHARPEKHAPLPPTGTPRK